MSDSGGNSEVQNTDKKVDSKEYAHKKEKMKTIENWIRAI
jgi:hypothetical protein